MTPATFLAKYPSLLAKYGSQRAVAKKTGIPRTTIQEWLAREQQILFSHRSPRPAKVVASPKRKTKRFLFTSAQNGTAVHAGFLANLEAYATFHEAPLIIGGFTYDKRLYQEHRKGEDFQEYDPAVRPYLVNHRMELGDNLLWLGEMNTLPTAKQPLSGFETYTGSKWGVIPHPKVQLRSIATMKGSLPKQIMTTGAVTVPNYVQKRAGIEAHFHHIIGAVIVELTASGDHFCRHLLADDNGNFQDLTYQITNGVVSDGHRVENITWGDVHHEQLDPVIAKAQWGVLDDEDEYDPICMLDWLRPKHQVLHDTMDFRARSVHNSRDPHYKFKMATRMQDSIEADLMNIYCFLKEVQRPWCQTHVVESNHDKHFLRWLKEQDWRDDPMNSVLHLEANLAALISIRDGHDAFSPLQWWLEREGLNGISFVPEDKSLMIAGIENGMHGHLGSNGSRGAPLQFTKAGPRSNTAHTHSPQILDGAYVAGTSSNLDMGYNRGLSSWAHACIITYENGKRTIVTLTPNGAWCAP